MFIVQARVRLKNVDLLEDACRWCSTFIGTENIDWYWGYVNDSPFDNKIDFSFRNESHAIFFKLRWL